VKTEPTHVCDPATAGWHAPERGSSRERVEDNVEHREPEHPDDEHSDGDRHRAEVVSGDDQSDDFGQR
jgi:hypothetical protein